MPISGKEMAKLFKKAGYEKIRKQGKGSHMKYRKGDKVVIIPNHKELKKYFTQLCEKYGILYRMNDIIDEARRYTKNKQMILF